MTTNITRYAAKSLSLVLGIILAALIAAGCRDDFMRFDPFGDGVANLNMTVNFIPMQEKALDTRSYAGDALKDMRDLAVVVFDVNGQLVDIFGYSQNDLTIKKDEPREGENLAESYTAMATAQLSGLRLGYYYIYAVSNLKLKSGEETSADVLWNWINEEFKDPKSFTKADLKKFRFDWDGDITDVTKNGEMFGWFSTENNYETTFRDALDAPMVTINKGGMNLYAWMRRAASKLTLSIDASGLRDNIWLYVQEVRIRDIAKGCYLGHPNVVNTTDSLINGGADSGMKLVVSEDKFVKDENNNDVVDPYKWTYVAKGRPYIPVPDNNLQGVTEAQNSYNKAHNEYAQALYFYENLQGVSDNPNEKLQYPDVTGEVVDNEQVKDGKEFGTYLEVVGYIHSNAQGNNNNGPVVYRFMLGENVTNDFNVKRNRHYKVVLKVRGNGNDIDWHIKYDKDDDPIKIANPYYVPYLYNTTNHMSVAIDEEGGTLISLRAQIIENNWGPKDPEDANINIYRGKYDKTKVWNGFLGLRRRDVVSVDPPYDTSSDYMNQDVWEKDSIGNAYYQIEHKNANEWYTLEGEDSKISSDSQNVNYVSGEALSAHVLQYRYKQTTNTEKIVEIPMSTRPKQLNKKTGYTGNNPYRAYQREAKLRLTATFRKDDGTTFTKEKTVTVLQVRRLVNPKGIYRRHDNDKAFNVTLINQESQTDPEYKPYYSQGPWLVRFYQYGGEDVNQGGVVSLPEQNGIKYTDLEGTTDYYYGGNTGSPIKFKISFNGTIEEDQTRCAIIEVLYNNFTCSHLIFVRQGYAPIQLNQETDVINSVFEGIGVRFTPTTTKWASFNMKTGTTLTDSPIEEGSMFRFGQQNYPLDATNWGINLSWSVNTPENFKGLGYDTLLTIAGTDKKILWKEIGNKDENGKVLPISIENDSFDFGTGLDPEDGWIYTPPTLADFFTLKEGHGIEEGYGICYADNSTKVSSSTTIATGYRHDRTGDGYGMRGCFVYQRTQKDPEKNDLVGNNLFFPIGWTGYGRVKNNQNGLEVKPQYAGSDYFIGGSGGDPDRPLLYPLYNNEGAIYWLGREYDKDGDPSKIVQQSGRPTPAWDINYINLDFNPFNTSNMKSTEGTDACFLRMVATKK